MQDSAPDSPSQRRPIASIAMRFVRVAIYILLIAPVFVFSALGGQWLGKVVWPGMSPLFHGVAWIAGVLLITWLMRVKVNKASWSGMALPAPQWLRLLLGAVAGFAVITVVSGIEYQLGWLHIVGIDTSLHRGLSKTLWMALALTPSLAVGFAEELAFRGYIFQTLGERMPVWTAGLLMSVIFAVLHFTLGGFDTAFVVSVIVLSLMFLSLRIATGSLWFPIGFHGAWDWTQTYFVGLATTGTQGYDPALIHVRQTGPSFWVGSQQAIESGLLFILVALGLLALALVYISLFGKSPPWTKRLAEETSQIRPDSFARPTAHHSQTHASSRTASGT
jgi:membrane protease YdiL (CAAX protease family)